ncbi:MAG: hypothetical protein ACREMX_02455 [Gemmatimonadales bacterium]
MSGMTGEQDAAAARAGRRRSSRSCSRPGNE